MFDGLTPTQAAILITRYTRPGQLVLDLTADLAVEGVAGAGGRSYARVHPAAVTVLVDAHRRGQWPTAHLILLRLPAATCTPTAPTPYVPPGAGDRESTSEEPDATLVQLLRDLSRLLHAEGHVVVTLPGPDLDSEPKAGQPGTRASLAAAAGRARLRLVRRHVITHGPLPDEGATAVRGDAVAANGPASGVTPERVELFVLSHRVRDD